MYGHDEETEGAEAHKEKHNVIPYRPSRKHIFKQTASQKRVKFHIPSSSTVFTSPTIPQQTTEDDYMDSGLPIQTEEIIVKVGANIGKHRKSRSVKIEYKNTQVSFDDMKYMETIHEEEKETPYGPYEYPETPGGTSTGRKLL